MAKKSTQKGTPKTAQSVSVSPEPKKAKDNKAGPKDGRQYTWATIVYPDDNPEFREKIHGLFLEGFISPLHTDKDEETQLEKKPHRHVLVKFPTKKSKQQVADVFAQFGGVGVEPVSNFRAYARYLCHLDQPDKKRYDPADVLTFGSLDYLSLIEAVSDRYRVVGEIMRFCKENPDRVKNSFARLLDICLEENEEWFRHLCDDCARVISDYLKSADWDEGREAREQDREYERKVRREQRAREKKQADEREEHYRLIRSREEEYTRLELERARKQAKDAEA